MADVKLAMIAAASLLLIQTGTACKNCVVLSKEEKALFVSHGAGCQAESGAAPSLVAGLLAGALAEDAALKRHVYCVLRRGKLLAKDGKLLKSPLLARLAAARPARNATKALEQCTEQSGDAASSPEEMAWTLFRCGYDRKALLSDYSPTDQVAHSN